MRELSRPPTWLGGSRLSNDPKTDKSLDDEVDRYDVIDGPGHQKNGYASYQRDERVEMSNSKIHLRGIFLWTDR